MAEATPEAGSAGAMAGEPAQVAKVAVVAAAEEVS